MVVVSIGGIDTLIPSSRNSHNPPQRSATTTPRHNSSKPTRSHVHALLLSQQASTAWPIRDIYMHTPAPHMAGGSSTSSGSCTATWRRRTATNATSPATVVVLLAALVLSLQLQQVSALYHTSSEVLHWFSHWAAKRPDVLRCVDTFAVVFCWKGWAFLGCMRVCFCLYWVPCVFVANVLAASEQSTSSQQQAAAVLYTLPCVAPTPPHEHEHTKHNHTPTTAGFVSCMRGRRAQPCLWQQYHTASTVSGSSTSSYMPACVRVCVS